MCKLIACVPELRHPKEAKCHWRGGRRKDVHNRQYYAHSTRKFCYFLTRSVFFLLLAIFGSDKFIIDHNDSMETHFYCLRDAYSPAICSTYNGSGSQPVKVKTT